jgi:biopolymer transport protein TolQ
MTHGVLLQVATAVPNSAWGLVLGSTPVTKGIVILLAALSLFSWTVMFAKWAEFASVRRRSAKFLSKFEHVERFNQALSIASRENPNPYTRVLRRASDFLTQGDIGFGSSGGRTSGPVGGVATAAPELSASQVEALRLILDSEVNAERDRLARFIPSLATIGSVSPLIGLLGTVLGVIDAFVGIATRGSGNIGAVAPGVAEALIATAAALSVAIPAAFGYNIFANRLNTFESQLDGFGTSVIALIVRDHAA